MDSLSASFPSLTFKCVIKLIFPKDDPQVMNSTGMKLYPEYHVSTRGSVTLVVALELKGESHKNKLKKQKQLNFKLQTCKQTWPTGCNR